MQRHSERVVHIVVEVGASTDNKIDEALLHQCDQASTEAGGCKSAGHGEADGHILFRGQHLLSIQMSCLIQTGRVVGLKLLINEFCHRHIRRDEPGYDLRSAQILALIGLVIIYIGGILMIVVHAIVILSERVSYGNGSMVTIVPHSATVPTLSGPPKQAVDPQLPHHPSRSWHSTDCAFALIRGS